jgi:hypothetical protein
MHVKARPLRQPSAHLGMPAGGVLIYNQGDIQFGGNTRIGSGDSAPFYFLQNRHGCSGIEAAGALLCQAEIAGGLVF